MQWTTFVTQFLLWTVCDTFNNANDLTGKTVWYVHTNGNVFPGLTLWDVHKNGNIFLGLTMCDIHTNRNVFLGFTVWDVHTYENDFWDSPCGMNIPTEKISGIHRVGCTYLWK